jgi:hypothetical protein
VGKASEGIYHVHCTFTCLAILWWQPWKPGLCALLLEMLILSCAVHGIAAALRSCSHQRPELLHKEQVAKNLSSPQALAHGICGTHAEDYHNRRMYCSHAAWIRQAATGLSGAPELLSAGHQKLVPL